MAGLRSAVLYSPVLGKHGCLDSSVVHQWESGMKSSGDSCTDFCSSVPLLLHGGCGCVVERCSSTNIHPVKTSAPRQFVVWQSSVGWVHKRLWGFFN